MKIQGILIDFIIIALQGAGGAFFILPQVAVEVCRSV
jgi:hypothetical protein